MARDWEASFTYWSQPPGRSEQDKRDNAERAVRKAIEASAAFEGRNVEVHTHGSYRNRTNIRTESDVDIGICCTHSFFFQLPEGAQPKDFGISTPASYPYAQYKNDVGQALTDYLGDEVVSRGKKAFDIHENTYRIDADGLACFEHRWYQADRTFKKGIAFVPDGGTRIINWPDQNYENGVSKNDATGRRFKALVRILKALRSEMESEGIAVANQIPSFLVECLVWNVPNDGFGHETLRADVRYVLAHLCDETRTANTCSEWGETNEYKYLFRQTQPWTRERVNAFLNAAWDYVGFE